LVSTIWITAEVLAPEFQLAVVNCHTPAVVEAVKDPIATPLIVNCSWAGDPELQLETQAENW
jgi:hypothetical protein